jgi:hypothetical protein
MEWTEWNEPIKLNISINIILKALSLEAGYSIKELKELYRKLGDIGDVGEYVWKHKKQKKLDAFY